MKLFSHRTIALLLSTAAISSSLPTMNVSTASERSSVPQQTSQKTDPLDLSLLSKAAATFFQSDRYQTESAMQVEAMSGDDTVTTAAQISAIVQAPNRFRVEIRFTPPGETKALKSFVISDGKQVWLYRPDLKQYAVMTYEAFDKLDDNYWVGMSSLWFLLFPADARKSVAEGALADPAVLKELGLDANSPLKGDRRAVDGQTFYVYSHTDKDGLKISGFVDPLNAVLKRLEIAGKSEGYDILIMEKILRRTANPPITASTFKFSPPKGAKLMKSLAIGPL